MLTHHILRFFLGCSTVVLLPLPFAHPANGSERSPAGGIANHDGETEVPFRAARKLTFRENAAGLQVGFWANYEHSGNLVRDFGPRPIERVNFHKWEQYETAPGVFEWDKAFHWERSAHLAGSTVITNVNTIFTYDLNPEGMHAMPDHVTPDIRDPETRAAARVFLAKFVERLLEETGTAWLVLDYEMLWFARPVTEEIRQTYRDWFIESAELARETARAIGMADRLKIGVIVNTNPFDTAGHSLGNPALPNHQPESWLLDCVAVSDFFGIDTYAGGHEGSVSPSEQLDVIRFWIQHYAGDLPVYVTESGFTSSREHGDDSHGYHIRGTEAEQAGFFADMFEALANKADDPLLRRVKAYCIWKYMDRNDEPDPVERHFGLRRDDADRSPKPAFGVVADAIASIESNAALAPVRPVLQRDILPELNGACAIPIERLSGTDYQALVVNFTVPASRTDALYLEVETQGPVAVHGRANALPWFTSHPVEATFHRIELRDLDPGSDVRLRLHFSSSRLPMQTAVQSLRIVSQP